MLSRPLRVWCILLSLAVTGGGRSSAAEPVAAPRTAPLALTPAEYNNTIADLLGFPRDGDRWPARPAIADTLSPPHAASKGVFVPPPPPPVWPWRFPAEPGSDGFEGIAQGQNPSSYQVEELHHAAMHFASFALVSPTFFSCATWATLPATQQETCAWMSLERFAERAYRRPLRAQERPVPSHRQQRRESHNRPIQADPYMAPFACVIATLHEPKFPICPWPKILSSRSSSL